MNTTTLPRSVVDVSPPQASTVAVVLVVAVANLVSTVARFGAMRTWTFRTGT